MTNIRQIVNHALQSLCCFAVVAGVCLGLGGCGEKPQSDLAPKPEPPNLRILCWDEYFNLDLLTQFNDRTGITVTVEIYKSTEEMEQKLRSDPAAYDLIIAEDPACEDMIRQRLVGRIGLESLLNAGNLDPKYLAPKFDQSNEYTVPYLWGTTLLACRSDLLKLETNTAKEFFRPDLKGKICMVEEGAECIALLIKLKGQSLATATKEQVHEAGLELQALVKDHGLRFGSDNEMKKFLISGECHLALMYSGDAALIASEHTNIHYFIPDSGAVIWTDRFCLSSDASHPKNARKFLDFMLEPQNSAATSNFLHYASPNIAAYDLLDDSLKNDSQIYPTAAIMANCEKMPEFTPEVQRELNIQWANVLRLRGEKVEEAAAGNTAK
jgi:spermidine/putrescine transport system substrate-binding protein